MPDFMTKASQESLFLLKKKPDGPMKVQLEESSLNTNSMGWGALQ
jgi:hypothetical protein